LPEPSSTPAPTTRSRRWDWRLYSASRCGRPPDTSYAGAGKPIPSASVTWSSNWRATRERSGVGPP
jgi:hypothetical protein